MGKLTSPVKNDDGEFVCQNCGIVLPDDYNPSGSSEKEYELGTDIDFSHVNPDSKNPSSNKYSSELRDIMERVEDYNDEERVAKKHEEIKNRAQALMNDLDIEHDLKEMIQQQTERMIELRVQAYEGYDLIPYLVVLDILYKKDLGTINSLKKLTTDYSDDLIKKYYRKVKDRL